MKGIVYWIMMFILGLGLLGCESGQSTLSSGPAKPPPEDPGIGIVKKTIMIDGLPWEDFCNKAAGVDGNVEWKGGPSSTVKNIQGFENLQKYVDNPELSIVLVRVQKNRTGERSKAEIIFVVNKNTKVVEAVAAGIDGKGEGLLMALASMELMVLEGSR